MICLGIESTAHTFGAGIVTGKGKVLANERDSFTTDQGGMIPAQAADHHVKVCDTVIKAALKKSGKNISDIGLIAFSQGPGLGHTLKIGAMAARSLSQIHGIPLVGVNHCIAHLEVGQLLFKAKNPVMLYASGANTQIIAYDAGRYRIFGETLDIGIGNFIDCLAREMGLGFPGGPDLMKLAAKGKEYIQLPYVVKGMDVSFGGLLTNLKQKIKSGKYSKEDLAFSAQETVFAMLIEVSERAMAHIGRDELIIGGGVGCNTRLQQMASIMCKERGAKCHVPANEFLVDNGLMIAWLGILQYNAAGASDDFAVRPYERTDDIEVAWK